jgi:putative transposase
MGWIDGAEELPLVRQCELAEVSRATVYRRRRPAEQGERAEDLLLCRLIDEEYTSRPFYGSRRMVVFLRSLGHVVNRKRVQRLMRGMGLAGMAPGPATSKKHPEHQVYPYLLRGVAVSKPNQVWSTDVTYIRLAKVLRQYDIAWTILSPEESLSRVMDSQPGWRRLYADRYAVIHVRSAP